MGFEHKGEEVDQAYFQDPEAEDTKIDQSEEQNPIDQDHSFFFEKEHPNLVDE
jgi:hypothetical protein